MCCENHSHPTRFGCTRGEIVEAAGTAGRKRTNSRTNSKMCGSRTREHRSRQHLDDARLLKTVSSPDRRLRLFGASTAIHWGSLSSTRFVKALWRRRASLPAARPHRSVAVNGSLVIRRSNDWPARECRSVSGNGHTIAVPAPSPDSCRRRLDHDSKRAADGRHSRLVQEQHPVCQSRTVSRVASL